MSDWDGYTNDLAGPLGCKKFSLAIFDVSSFLEMQECLKIRGRLLRPLIDLQSKKCFIQKDSF